MELKNEKLAFEREYKGFKIKAFWGDESDARIEITKNETKYKTFFYPAYKIFNLQAHFEDIIDGELKNSVDGYKITGSDGLGGSVMPKEI